MKRFLILAVLILIFSEGYSQWTPTNGISGAPITSMVVDPLTGYIYAGSYQNGTYVTKDKGENWIIVNKGLPAEMVLNTLAIKGNTIFAGMNNGIFKSVDNGDYWSVASKGVNNPTRAITFDGNDIYAITDLGIFSSSNDGDTWSEITNNLTNNSKTSIVIWDNNVYVGTSNGVFYSNNKGTSWIPVNTGLTNTSITCLVSDNNKLYAGTPSGIFLLLNNETTWNLISSNISDNNIKTIVIDGNDIYAATNNGIELSNNNGTSWTNIKTNLNVKSLLRFSGILYAGTNEGIFIFNNNSWVKSWKGLSNGTVNLLSGSGNTIFAQNENSELFCSLDEGNTWAEAYSDLPNLRSLAINGNKAFAATSNGVFLSEDNGSSWNNINNGLTNTNVNTITINNNFIFVGTTNGMFVSSNDGTNWSAINAGLTTTNITSLSAYGNNVVAGTTNGVFLSENNGNNWLPIGLPGVTINEVAINNSTILACSNRQLFLSENNGTSWKMIFGNNNLNYESLTLNGSNIFVGTNSGLYLSDNKGDSWVLVNDGLYMAHTYVNSNYIFGGTRRGLWKRPLDEILQNKYSAPASQAFNIRPSFIQAGQISISWLSQIQGSKLVFIKEGNSGTAIPKDGVTYTPSSTFGSGTRIENTDWYCVYNGKQTSDTITGLKPNTEYRIMVLEYSGTSGKERYQTNTNINNPITQATKKGVADLVETSTLNYAFAKSFSYKHIIYSEGKAGMIKHGICWSINPLPTLKDSMLIDGTEIGSYKGLVGNLKVNTQYYARTFTVFPSDTVYSEEFSFRTKTEQGAMVDAYDMLMPPLYITHMDLYGWGKDPNNWVFGSIAGGDANKGSELSDQPQILKIQRYNEDPENSYMLEKWLVMQEGIIRCNDAMIAITGNQSLSSDDKKIKLGELYFLRAFYNFELIKTFGPKLPWIDEKNMYDPAPKSRKAAIWSNVEDDFLIAINSLPSVSDSAGQVNVWAAKAFYAKILLYQKKYSQAKTIFDDVIANGKTTSGASYSLLAKFDSNFNALLNNSSESVFAQQAKMDGDRNIKANPGFSLAYPVGPQEMGTCCGFFQPSNSLVNSFKVDGNGLPLFDPNHNTFPFNSSDLKNDAGLNSYDNYTPDITTAIDPRIDWTVGRRGIPYLDWGINPGKNWIRDQQNGGPYLPMKNVFRKDDKINGRTGYVESWATGSLINYNLMRFADVLLMAAECEVELGNLTNALTYVNQVRLRANNSHVKNGNQDAANYQISIYGNFASQQYAREAVRFERKLELAMEGHRFFDLSRWGGAYAAQELNAGYLAHESISKSHFAGSTFDTCQLYFTIPQKVGLYLPPFKYINDSAFILNSETPSGLEVNYKVSDTTVVKLRGNKLIIVGLGTDTITVSYSVKPGCLAPSVDKKIIRIIKRSQTINFDDLGTKHYGDASITLNAAASSGLPVSYSVKNNSIIKVLGNQLQIMGVGTDTISASQSGDNFYDEAPVQKRIITVLKSNQFITFDSISPKRKGDAAFALSATSTSGLPVNFSVKDTTVVKIVGNSLYFLNAGTDTIFATQEGNAYYDAAPKVYRVIKVDVGTNAPLLENAQLQLYPNPTKESLTLIIPGSGKRINISINNINGRTVYNQALKNMSSGQVKIELNTLKQGSYFIKVVSGQETYYGKFMKE